MNNTMWNCEYTQSLMCQRVVPGIYKALPGGYDRIRIISIHLPEHPDCHTNRVEYKATMIPDDGSGISDYHPYWVVPCNECPYH